MTTITTCGRCGGIYAPNHYCAGPCPDARIVLARLESAVVVAMERRAELVAKAERERRHEH